MPCSIYRPAQNNAAEYEFPFLLKDFIENLARFPYEPNNIDQFSYYILVDCRKAVAASDVIFILVLPIILTKRQAFGLSIVPGYDLYETQPTTVFDFGSPVDVIPMKAKPIGTGTTNRFSLNSNV